LSEKIETRLLLAAIPSTTILVKVRCFVIRQKPKSLSFLRFYISIISTYEETIASFQLHLFVKIGMGEDLLRTATFNNFTGRNSHSSNAPWEILFNFDSEENTTLMRLDLKNSLFLMSLIEVGMSIAPRAHPPNAISPIVRTFEFGENATLFTFELANAWTPISSTEEGTSIASRAQLSNAHYPIFFNFES